MIELTRFCEAGPEIRRLVIDAHVVEPFPMARAALPHMLAAGWGRIGNITISAETMRRRGFSPYSPSKAALGSETIIGALSLPGTGVSVDTLLPRGTVRAGMISAGYPDDLRCRLLDAEIVVPPILWLESARSNGVTGRGVAATRWRVEAPESAEEAGW